MGSACSGGDEVAEGPATATTPCPHTQFNTKSELHEGDRVKVYSMDLNENSGLNIKGYIASVKSGEYVVKDSEEGLVTERNIVVEFDGECIPVGLRTEYLQGDIRMRKLCELCGADIKVDKPENAPDPDTLEKADDPNDGLASQGNEEVERTKTVRFLSPFETWLEAEELGEITQVLQAKCGIKRVDDLLSASESDLDKICDTAGIDVGAKLRLKTALREYKRKNRMERTESDKKMVEEVKRYLDTCETDDAELKHTIQEAADQDQAMSAQIQQLLAKAHDMDEIMFRPDFDDIDSAMIKNMEQQAHEVEALVTGMEKITGDSNTNNPMTPQSPLMNVAELNLDSVPPPSNTSTSSGLSPTQKTDMSTSEPAQKADTSTSLSQHQ